MGVTYERTGVNAREDQVLAYIRVSTDLQDVGKQRETLKHHSKLKGLKITRFVEIEMSST
jgi:DNA invertase Pin-like site-specific DNA recombinase